jgi:uncharacterized protein
MSALPARVDLLALLLALATPAAARAQSEALNYPDPLTPFVSDFADILDPAAEARITAALSAARDDPGAEIAVVTIGSRRDYGPHPSLESFANGLFNAWGIGAAEPNNGILILVADDDREMRIELGSGYAPSWAFTAEEIVHRTMLPSFQTGDLPAGIEAGTQAAIDRIARPFADALPQEHGLRSWLRSWGPGALFAAIMGAIVALAAAAKFRQRPPPCPACHHSRATVSRRVLQPATRDAAGRAEETITCRNCGLTRHRDLDLPAKGRSRSNDGSSSGFGGGSSSGTGASGRW